MRACLLLWPFYLDGLHQRYVLLHASQRERLRGNLLHTFPDIESRSFETYVAENI